MLVIGHSNPASHGRMKTSHFEKGVVCRLGSLAFGNAEGCLNGKPAQDDEDQRDTNITRKMLVPAADCPRVGRGPGNGPAVRAVGGFKLRQCAHRVGGGSPPSSRKVKN